MDTLWVGILPFVVFLLWVASDAHDTWKGLKMEKTKYYRTIIQVEVLSEEPVHFDNLGQVHEAITNGDCSGQFEVTAQVEVSPENMARLMEAQGSDPAFFEDLAEIA